MNQKLINDITSRVEQAKKAQEDESILAAHLDAIAEVYDTDRAIVESIAREAIGDGGIHKKSIDLAKVRNVVWISALVLIMIAVIWLLWINAQTHKTSRSDSASKTDKLSASYVHEALASLNVVKVSMVEHYHSAGRLPSSFAEIGIKESELIATKYIERLQMDDNSTIMVSLSGLVGEQRYIKLTPITRIASHTIEWECRSNLKQAILNETPGCTPDN